MVKAVTLDLGCTLVYESSCEGVWPSNVSARVAERLSEFLRSQGYSVKAEDILGLEPSWDEFLSKYYDSLTEVSLELKTSFLLSKLGITPRPLLVEGALSSAVEAFLETRVAYDDVVKFLREARRLKLRIAIISNTNSHSGYIETLKKLGVIEYFDLVITSHIVVYKKPMQEIFRITAELLGLEPNQIIHIGDSLADVEGALGAGYMDAIEIKRHGECRTRRCYKSLEDAMRYIALRYLK